MTTSSLAGIKKLFLSKRQNDAILFNRPLFLTVTLPSLSRPRQNEVARFNLKPANTGSILLQSGRRWLARRVFAPATTPFRSASRDRDPLRGAASRSNPVKPELPKTKKPHKFRHLKRKASKMNGFFELLKNVWWKSTPRASASADSDIAESCCTLVGNASCV